MFHPLGKMVIIDTEDDASNQFVKRIVYDTLQMYMQNDEVVPRTAFLQEYAEALTTFVNEMNDRHIEFLFTDAEGGEVWLKKRQFQDHDSLKFEGKFRVTGTPIVTTNKQLKGIKHYAGLVDRDAFGKTIWADFPREEVDMVLDRMLVRS